MNQKLILSRHIRPMLFFKRHTEKDNDAPNEIVHLEETQQAHETLLKIAGSYNLLAV
jgi:hypothetical protein